LKIVPQSAEAPVARVPEKGGTKCGARFVVSAKQAEARGQAPQVFRIILVQLDGQPQVAEPVLAVALANRQEATFAGAIGLIGIDFQRPAIVFQCPLGVAAAIGFNRACHQIVVSSIVGLVSERGRQVATGFAWALPAEINFSEADLRFFGHCSRQLPKTCQLPEQLQGVVVAPELLEVSAAGKKAIHQIERRAHAAASVQVMGSSSLCSCTS
jgi:hypothetical protein